MTDIKTEEAKNYTKTALMRMLKPDLIAVASEMGVDLEVLPELTKDAISDAIMVFLEPYLDPKVPEVPPVEPIITPDDEEVVSDDDAIQDQQDELPTNIMAGTSQTILRPHTEEKSVRVRRITKSDE